MFEKEAEEYFETECLHSYADTEEQLKEDVVPAFQKGAEFGYNKAKEELEKDNNRLFLEGAKRVEELEAQIEKMKCCEMCKHKNFNWGFSPICEARDKIKIKNPLTCKCDKWEIKEND